MNKKSLITTCCLAGLAIAGQAEQPEQRPNIVFIYADDIGYGDLSCYGAEAVQTPHSDRLAKEGLLFTNAYAPAATCTPSRYGLLTGEYPFRRPHTGIARADTPMVIRKEQHTVASLLQEAGYTTGVVGKWHLGLGEGRRGSQDWNGLLAPGPNEIGFDYSFIMPTSGDRVPCVWVENGRVVNLDPDDPLEVSNTEPFEGEPLGRTHPDLLTMHPSHGHDRAIINGIPRIGYMRGGTSAHWVDEEIADDITAKSIEFIEKNNPEVTGKPFFLYFSTHDIHVPRVAHPRFVGATDMGPRGDTIVQFDWSVGEILATLDRLGLAENTLVILTSDNGPVLDDGYKDEAVGRLGDHKPWGPFRGGKYSAFEAGTRLPFLVRWPGEVEPGTVSDAAVTQMDFYGVMAALTGQPIPEGAAPDSLDQLDAWLGRSATGRDYIIQMALRRTLTIQQDEWKYIVPSDAPRLHRGANIELGNATVPQLYYLVDDPGETNNLAEEHPEIVERLANLLAEVREAEMTR